MNCCLCDRRPRMNPEHQCPKCAVKAVARYRLDGYGWRICRVCHDELADEVKATPSNGRPRKRVLRILNWRGLLTVQGVLEKNLCASIPVFEVLNPKDPKRPDVDLWDLDVYIEGVDRECIKDLKKSILQAHNLSRPPEKVRA